MALGRTLVEDFEIIAPEDAALDQDADGFADKYSLYIDDGDEAHLPLIEGKTPVRWKLRHLPRRILRRIADRAAGKGNEATMDLAAYALIGVSGLRTEDGKDARIDFEGPDEYGYKRVSEADLDWIDRNYDGLITFIGALVMKRMHPDPKS